jgi:hypothetical protein
MKGGNSQGVKEVGGASAGRKGGHGGGGATA